MYGIFFKGILIICQEKIEFLVKTESDQIKSSCSKNTNGQRRAWAEILGFTRLQIEPGPGHSSPCRPITQSPNATATPFSSYQNLSFLFFSSFEVH